MSLRTALPTLWNRQTISVNPGKPGLVTEFGDDMLTRLAFCHAPSVEVGANGEALSTSYPSKDETEQRGRHDSDQYDDVTNPACHFVLTPEALSA